MPKLERAAYVLFILVCVAGLGALARQELFPRVPAPSTPNLVGRHLSIPGLQPQPKQSELSLVVVVRSDCHFCVESLPFYRELDRRHKIHPGQFSLYVVSNEPVEKLRAFVDNSSMSPDGIATVDFSNIGIPGTPTVAVIDKTGMVKRIFFGKLGDSASRELLALIDDLREPRAPGV